ncbi:hypothetical protein GT042_23450, partial [Streptomyces sp. SID3212]|nr:hypothetical protein [Streptomyces sp. SID3212]
TAARAADAALAAEHAYDAERRAAESLAQDERLAELLSLPPTPQPGVPAPRTSAATHERSSRPTRVTAKVPTPPRSPLGEVTPETTRVEGGASPIPGEARGVSSGTTSAAHAGSVDRPSGTVGEADPGGQSRSSAAPGGAGTVAHGGSSVVPAAGAGGSGESGVASDPAGAASDGGRPLGRGGEPGGIAPGSYDAAGAAGTASGGRRRQAHDDLAGAGAADGTAPVGDPDLQGPSAD